MGLKFCSDFFWVRDFGNFLIGFFGVTFWAVGHFLGQGLA